MSTAELGLRVTWPGELERSKELFAGVQRANQVLGDELGRSKSLVTAEWKPINDNQNRVVLELTLTDLFTRSQLVEKFSPEEFHNEPHLGSRFHRMWGRLLQARADRQIKNLEQLGGQEEGV